MDSYDYAKNSGASLEGVDEYTARYLEDMLDREDVGPEIADAVKYTSKDYILKIMRERLSVGDHEPYPRLSISALRSICLDVLLELTETHPELKKYRGVRLGNDLGL